MWDARGWVLPRSIADGLEAEARGLGEHAMLSKWLRQGEKKVGEGKEGKEAHLHMVMLRKMIRHTILSTGREMPARIVGLLDTLCMSQKLYLRDPYCHRKLVPKVILPT